VTPSHPALVGCEIIYAIRGRLAQLRGVSPTNGDKYEGVARNNLGDTLRKLRRFDGARREIRRAIECDAQFGHPSQPWTAWNILADIETDAGTPPPPPSRGARLAPATSAGDNGENHDADGRICLAVTQALLVGEPGAAASLLQQLAAHPDLPNQACFLYRNPTDSARAAGFLSKTSSKVSACGRRVGGVTTQTARLTHLTSNLSRNEIGGAS